jgi:hypothetical protein
MAHVLGEQTTSRNALRAGLKFCNCDHMKWAHYTITAQTGSMLNLQYERQICSPETEIS